MIVEFLCAFSYNLSIHFYGDFRHEAKKKEVEQQLENRSLHRFGLIRNLRLIQQDFFK